MRHFNASYSSKIYDEEKMIKASEIIKKAPYLRRTPKENLEMERKLQRSRRKGKEQHRR
jgi:hypothetical protein